MNTLNRRTFLAGMAAISTAVPLGSYGQDFPNKLITIVVASAPGGIIDFVGRAAGAAIAESLKATVIVENRPGGNGHIGASHVAKSKPDGYTLLCTSGATLTSGVVRGLNYDPIKELTPVARLIVTPVYLVVAADSPYKTVKDLIAAAKEKPGSVFFGSTNAGNSTHIGGEMLNVMGGMSATHVPYKGSGPALLDLVGGRIQFMFDTRPSTMPLVEGGKLRILAVSSPQRQKDLPDVPTVAETIPGFELEGWGGLFAPAATDIVVLEKLAAAQKLALDSSDFADKLRKAGEVAYLSPIPARAYMLEDYERVSKIVRAANIRVN